MNIQFARLSYLVFIGALVLGTADVAAQPKKVVLSAKTYVDRDPVVAGGEAYVAFAFEVPKKYHINAHKPLESHLIATNLSLDLPEGFTVREVVYPEAEMVRTGGSDVPIAVYGGRFFIGVALDLSPSVAPGDYTVTGHLRYQACDSHVCFFPTTRDVQLSIPVAGAGTRTTARNQAIFQRIKFSQGSPAQAGGAGTGGASAGVSQATGEDRALTLLDDFVVLKTAGGQLDADAFLQFIASAEQGTPASSDGGLAGKGPLVVLILVLLGGMALNLTPCVLPLIPINLAIIGAGTEANNRMQGFALGGTYGLGMAIAYGLLGLIVVLTSSTFGAINASPWFNVAIAVLFVVLALAMFDIITIDFSSLQSKINFGQKSKGSYAVAFVLGAVAALLAGACVAPVVIQVIVLASDLYAKGHQLALALPFLLGVGMALPWPIAGAGLSALPRPGAWMTRVKQVFGILILGFAAYYCYLAYELWSVSPPEEPGSNAEQMVHEGWIPSLEQGLELARKNNQKVLVDVWATWCKNCFAMDKTTLRDPKVLAALKDYVKIKYQAEEINESPAKDVVARFKGIGLPLYAILEPKPEAGGGEAN